MLLTDRGHLFRVTVLAPFYLQSSTQSCHVSFHPDCGIRSLLQSGATVLSIRLSSLQLIASFHRKCVSKMANNSEGLFLLSSERSPLDTQARAMSLPC